MGVLTRLIDIETQKSEYGKMNHGDGNNDIQDIEEQINKHKIPEYVQCLFHFQCLNIKQVNFDIDVLHDIYSDNNDNNIFISNKGDLINIELFIKLYANMEYLKINLRDKLEMSLNFYHRITFILNQLQSMP